MRHARTLGAAWLLASWAFGCAPGAGGPQGDAPAAEAPRPSAGCREPGRPALIEHHAEIHVAGERRGYIIDAPPSATADPRPLVLAFHGFGGDAAGFRQGLPLHELAQREGVIVVWANGRDEGVRLLGRVARGWDMVPGGPDPAFVAALLDRLESTRCVDQRRIFATGFSNGGFFTNLLGCTFADRLAAIAPVGGASALPGCTPVRSVPVLLLHGSADRVVDPAMARGARDWWAAQNGCGTAVSEGGCARFDECAADVVYCEGQRGHRWPPDGLARLWRFFAAHPLPRKPG